MVDYVDLKTANAWHKGVAILRVTSGNFIEMFDFFLFGFYATYISQAFFPSHSPIAGLIKTFMVFGAGFLMRPLGAIFLGAYVDHIGRKKGLILTLFLMAMGTMLIAFVPSYSTIGITAPILVLLGRLLQGFSAGVELGGVSVYLSEIATPGHRGFYVSWQSGSQQVSVMAAAVLGFLVNHYMGQAVIAAWGWRIPFLVGCLIVPLLFILRRSMQETEFFMQRKTHPSPRQIFMSIWHNKLLVICGMFLVAMTTASFYLITVFTPTYGKAILHLTTQDSLLVTLCIAISNLFWLPVMGAASDKFGRKPILLIFTLLGIFTAYPVFFWMVHHISFVNMLIAELWLSFIYASYNGAMIVALTEVMPVEVRTSGFSLAYSLATAIFGGFTPAIATYFSEALQNKAAPALWMSSAAILSFAATLILYRWQKKRLATQGNAV